MEVLLSIINIISDVSSSDFDSPTTNNYKRSASACWTTETAQRLGSLRDLPALNYSLGMFRPEHLPSTSLPFSRMQHNNKMMPTTTHDILATRAQHQAGSHEYGSHSPTAHTTKFERYSGLVDWMSKR